MVLQYHPEFASLSWDVVRQRIVWHGEPIGPENSLLFMTGLLNRTSALLIGNSYEQVIETVARKRPVNPLADMIMATQWDGVRRVEALWTYLGLGIASEWNICGPKRWFLGLVNRVLHPGAQSDLMLVLEGPQGVGKSSALRALAEPFGFPGFATISGFGSASTMNASDMMILSGKLLIEMSEMTAHRRSDNDYFKGMLSKTEDRYRSPYGRHFLDVPRTASFAGTTNRRDAYFTDATGGRRFVPVESMAQIDLAGLVDDREQLYAEAAMMLQHGELPYFNEAEEALQDEEVAKRTSVTLIKEQVEVALEEHRGDTIVPVMLYALLGISDIPFHEKARAKPLIDAAMAELGWCWSDKTLTEDGRRRRAWTRGERKQGRPPKPRQPRPAWWPKD
jgi:predicted P-loop ATPase